MYYFYVSAEFIVAGQFSTAIDLFLTILIIGIFYKEPSTPIPQWLQFFTFKMIKPITFIGDIPKQKQVSPNQSLELVNKENSNGKKEENEENIKENEENLDVRNDEHGVQWQMVAKILDRFLFIVNLSAILISVLILIIVMDIS